MLIGNRQEAFDFVVRHLFKQGERAVAEGGGCLYRGPDGTKCAVGCLIPDELYTPRLEGNSVFMLPQRVLDQLPAPSLLNELQIAHDDPTNWWNPTRLRYHLTVIAQHWALNTDALEEAYNNATW
ncbi:hypothetical protein ACUN0C_19080 [Faunimonas sp. B44]|uniref:hypothetical protein n=1 Tax=Faunimonas sp. B44 TaxID=3461493 RepID=UPI0040445146